LKRGDDRTDIRLLNHETMVASGAIWFYDLGLVGGGIEVPMIYVECYEYGRGHGQDEV